jgi:ketosteroid isomerase-like protein
MSNVKELDQSLNKLILSGEALEGFDKYYDEKVVMVEPTQSYEGKEVNRKREEEFFSGIEKIHKFDIKNEAYGEDVTYNTQLIHVTFKNGYTMNVEQAVIRYWKDNKIIKEQFFYNAPNQ